MKDKQAILNFLHREKEQLSLASISTLPFDETSLFKLKEMFSLQDNSTKPEYYQKTAHLRTNPKEFFPWAKSIVMIAIPCKTIPALSETNQLPTSNNRELSGLIAGYSTLIDYHTYGKRILENISQSFELFWGEELKIEICIDTKPVAEKLLGEISNLGAIGLNSCLLVQYEGSGCFIGALIIDQELPSLTTTQTDSKCSECQKCKTSCPNNAIINPQHFNYTDCISYLTMEKRGNLTTTERHKIGEWVFGCDNCTAPCPGTKLPKAQEVDLEYLLMSNSNTIKRQIKGSALEYAGITQLRRNALAVLSNRHLRSGKELIQKFAKLTQSKQLKQEAEDILQHWN